MGCNDFLITIKCDDVHTTTYWNDIQDKPDLATKDEIVTEFKTINGETITGTGNIEVAANVDTSNLVTRDEMSNYPNRNNYEDIYQQWNFQNGILEYGEWIGARYMPQNQPFKTINGETITGTGNIEISGGSGETIDTSNLVTRDEMSNYPNRHNQEDIYHHWNFHSGISEYGSPLSDRYMSNQPFKTINGESIFGDGNIEISGGSGEGGTTSSGTALEVKNGAGYSIQFLTRYDYSGLQSGGNIDSQCLYVITD